MQVVETDRLSPQVNIHKDDILTVAGRTRLVAEINRVGLGQEAASAVESIDGTGNLWSTTSAGGNTGGDGSTITMN